MLENNKNKVLSQHKVLLIDSENCPNHIKQLQHDLAIFSQVVICYAQCSPKIPLEWVIPLATAVHQNKLKIIKMESHGKNSADFGLCFYAGILMQSLPQETHFVIISNDTDLDHVVKLLISHERSAERIGMQKEATQKVNDENSHLSLYCSHLITYKKNRPAKESTLINSIKTKFKDTPIIADNVFKALINQAAVKVVDGKITYNDSKIEFLAKQS